MPFIATPRRHRGFPFLHRAARKRCPFCFRDVDIGCCRVVRTSRSQDAIEREAAEELVPQPRGWRRIVSWFWVPTLIGEPYASGLARWECPHEDCQALLPDGFESMDSVIIGVVGPTQASKSHFVAVLITLLTRGGALDRYDCHVAAADRSIERRFNDRFYRPLMVEHTALPPTPRFDPTNDVTKPLVYTLTFRTRDRQGRPTGEKTLILSFYDAQGEDLLNEDVLGRSRYLRYTVHADALIFLIDPLTLPTVRSALEEARHVPADASESALDLQRHPASMINNLVADARRHLKVNVNRSWNTHLALALAKCDLLDGLSLTGDDSDWLFDELPLDGSYDIHLVKQRSQDIQNKLEEIDGPGIAQATRRFRSVSHHALSATGQSPSAEGIYPGGPAPRGCLDPLLCSLHVLGVIPASGVRRSHALRARQPAAASTHARADIVRSEQPTLWARHNGAGDLPALQEPPIRPGQARLETVNDEARDD